MIRNSLSKESCFGKKRRWLEDICSIDLSLPHMSDFESLQILPKNSNPAAYYSLSKKYKKNQCKTCFSQHAKKKTAHTRENRSIPFLIRRFTDCNLDKALESLLIRVAGHLYQVHNTKYTICNVHRRHNKQTTRCTYIANGSLCSRKICRVQETTD